MHTHTYTAGQLPPAHRHRVRPQRDRNQLPRHPIQHSHTGHRQAQHPAPRDIYASAIRPTVHPGPPRHTRLRDILTLRSRTYHSAVHVDGSDVHVIRQHVRGPELERICFTARDPGRGSDARNKVLCQAGWRAPGRRRVHRSAVV